MSFPKYDRYKNSGMEWLGGVPEHWNTLPIRHIIDQIESGTSVNASDEPAAEGEVGVLKTSCVYSGQFDSSQNKTVIKSEITRVTCHLKANTLIVSRMNTPELVGATGLVKSEVENIYLPDRLWQVSFSSAEPNFVYYWSQSNLYRGLIKATCSGTSSSMQNLGQDQFRSFYIPLPPLPEQRSIATFLDRETTKIDELIAEQQQLIDLLKEKRQAVISHAVTKGLNPDAPMKDSAIEWLGEVPEHWEITQLKHVVAIPITDGPHETPEFLDEGVSFVSAEAISSGMINFSKIRGFISEEVNKRYSQKYSPKLHDIYLIKSGATTGTTAIVESRTDFNIWSPLAAIRCSEIVNPYFVLNFMRSKNFQEAITLNWSFGTQQNIGMRVIENLAHTLPPLPEQRSIAAFLDRETAKFDELIAEAHHAIALLQERRTALISAAVTGKIDVRSLV